MARVAAAQLESVTEREIASSGRHREFKTRPRNMCKRTLLGSERRTLRYRQNPGEIALLGEPLPERNLRLNESKELCGLVPR